jgi:hypothetical protein
MDLRMDKSVKKIKVPVDKWQAYFEEKSVRLSHVKYQISCLGEEDEHVIYMFRRYVPQLEEVESISHPDPTVNTYMVKNVGIELVYACKMYLAHERALNIRTVIPVVLAMNQVNKAQVEFRGGETPGYHVAKMIDEDGNNGFNDSKPDEYYCGIDSDDEEEVPVKKYQTSKEDEVRILVCSGVPILEKDGGAKMEKFYDIKGVNTPSPEVANLATMTASVLDHKIYDDKGELKTEVIYHKFGDKKDADMGDAYQDNMLITPTTVAMKKVFNFPVDNKEELLQSVIQMAEGNEGMLKSIPLNQIDSICYRSSYKGKEFMTMTLTALSKLWENVAKNAERILPLLKNYDVGSDYINIPLEMNPVLAYIQGESPYVQKGMVIESTSYLRKDYVVHYGAACGALDALLRSYFVGVVGCDRTNYISNVWHDKCDTSETCKLGAWFQSPIEDYSRSKEKVVINTLEGKSWNTKEGNRRMVQRLTAMMRGYILKGKEERCFGSTKNLTYVARIRLPLEENLHYFLGCFPFVVAFVCRALDNNAVIIKNFDGMEDKHFVKTCKLNVIFQDESVGGRFVLVKDVGEFRHILQLKVSGQLSELFMHMDRLNTSWKVPLVSVRNRRWFLAGPQMPNMYRTAEVAMDLGSVIWPYDSEVMKAFNILHKERTNEETNEKVVPRRKKRDKDESEEVEVKRFDCTGLKF